jgi:hypothetical protein
MREDLEMSETTLLPCPFCEGEARVQSADEDTLFFVCCLSPLCYCSLGERYDPDGMSEHFFYKREDAIAAWNARVDPQRQRLDAEVAALQAEVERLKAPVSNEEYRNEDYGVVSQSCRKGIDAMIAARATGATGGEHNDKE